LAFNQTPKSLEVAGLVIDAVRIPHAGWPGRADIENLVFRVTLKTKFSMFARPGQPASGIRTASITKPGTFKDFGV
jgi:hypothetical protein